MGRMYFFDGVHVPILLKEVSTLVPGRQPEHGGSYTCPQVLESIEQLEKIRSNLAMSCARRSLKE